MPAVITNKLNLPETIYKACLHDSHRVAGDISVSQLIDSPRIRILKKKHKYEEDVSDRLYMLLGTALHHILERANIDDVRKRAFILTADTLIAKAQEYQNANEEARANQLRACAKYLQDLIPVFFPEIGNRYIFEVTLRREINGIVLYGTFDLFDTLTNTLYDYKFCSVYSYMYPESKDSWAYQTNIYAWLLKMEGYTVNKIVVVAFFRDWQESGIMRHKDYPDKQIKEIVIPIGETPKVGSWIGELLTFHKETEDTGILPLCTGQQRWAKADQWAVKTPNAKKALRVADTEGQVDSFILENKHKHPKMYKEYRPGESVKCASFCPVAEFCDQRKEELRLRKEITDKE
jgi:hypothetical protein